MDRQIAMWRKSTDPDEHLVSARSLKTQQSQVKESEPRSSHRQEREGNETGDEELGNELKEKFRSLWSGLGDGDD